MPGASFWRGTVDDARRIQWIITASVAAAVGVFWVLRRVSAVDPAYQIVFALSAAAAVAVATTYVTLWTHHHRRWPATHPLAERQSRPKPSNGEHRAASDTGHHGEVLPHDELSLAIEQRDNNVALVLRNGKGEPKANYAVWLEDLQLYSASVGFHPVPQFDKRANRVANAYPIHRAKSWLYHGQKDECRMIQWNSGKPHIRCRDNDSYTDIRLSLGTSRVRLRLEWMGRTRLHDMFILRGARSVLLTTAPV
jgi:hypothetical protein